MKMFRSPWKARAIAVFLLLNFVQSMMAPYYASALTTGPHQPEYTSYEEPGATDMVNLLTGDFNFSIPAMEVPGPEGSFSLPLTYNAGIGLDQEASWVGLGWTMNAGAITRSINEFPDDANGESHSITKQDLVGVRGWTSALLGLGNIGWNTQQGHYGSISLLGLLDADYTSSGISSVGIAGVSFDKNGVSVDPVKLAVAAITVATAGATAAAAGTSAGAAAVEAGKTAVQVGQAVSAATSNSIIKQAATQLVASGGLSAIFQASTPSASSSGYWSYNKKRESKRLFHKNYWIWLDQTRTEKMFGSMYLGNAQGATVSNGFTLNINGAPAYSYLNSNNVGSASDVNQYIDPNKNYYEVDNPTLLANDNFSVKAPGISGSISPYRLDIGSVSMPREMTTNHTRYVVNNYTNYKVPFIYEGANAGNYLHHLGATGVPYPSTPAFYFGATQSTSTDPIFNTPVINLNINDISFSQRIRPDASTSYRIPAGNHVEWLSNAEILNDVTRTSLGFMDFLNATDRATFRNTFNVALESKTYNVTMPSFSTTIPMGSQITDFSNGDLATLNLKVLIGLAYAYVTVIDLPVTVTGNSISVSSSLLNPYLSFYTEVEIVLKKTQKSPTAIGGYVVTSTNGLNYHFALPSYDYEQKTIIKDKDNPTTKLTTLNRVGAFANTWLLTGITGPDFVDRGPGGVANGIIDENDWGYWVKLNYGKHADNFQWRIPYINDKRDADNQVDTNTTGKKQMYYLNSIETRSHVALFLKELRADSRSINSIQSARLNEICLLKRDHFKTLVTSYSVPDYSAGITNMCWSSSFAGATQTFLYQNSIRRIGFTYNYSLCPGTLNSTSSGKLTLTRLATYGRNSAKVMPDYLFEYGNNPSYSINNWDGWGMYKSDGTQTDHTSSAVDADGAAWSLTKVTNPLGSQIVINYERDTYKSVSGQTFYGPIYNFVEAKAQSPNTGLLSFTVAHNGSLISGDQLQIDGTYSFTCPSTSQFVTGTFSGLNSVNSVSGTTITLNGSAGATFQCSGSTPTITFEGTVKEIETRKKGGGVRVASLEINDDNKKYKTRYLYAADDVTTSSGVVAQEPPYIKKQNFVFDNIAGYPMTPVMYGKVTVLNGKLTNDNDWDTKEVYRFETPSISHLTYIKEQFLNQQFIGGGNYWTMSHHKLEDNTGKMGRLNSIEIHSQAGLVSSSQMNYSSQILNANGANNYQGIYSMGSLIFDRVVNGEYKYYRYGKTSELKYPNVLTKVVTTKDGFTSENENKSWDFISGAVNEKIERSALGVNIKTVIKPAYLVPEYAEMGSKASNIAYKNMLGQTAATYVYRTDATGTTSYGLVSAQANTWQKTWNNYRVLAAGVYGDNSEGPAMWRRAASYYYKGSYNLRQADGTLSFAPANEFSFATGAANTNWQKAGEAKRYDHFSMALESADLNLIPSSVKMGYNDIFKIAEAGNAAYNEMAFSSAEDLNSTTAFFGGEVALGSGTVSTASAHAGTSSLSLTTGYGFVFKPTGLKTNRTYRAGVWTNSVNGRIYYKLNGGAEQLSAVPTQQVNGWYLVDLPIDVGATFTSLEVGAKAASGTVLFDDFRFQPADAALTAYVYNPATWELQYVLDNDNLFTKYEYNDRGLLIKTYRESIKFNGVKLVSETRDNYKRFNTNP